MSGVILFMYHCMNIYIYISKIISIDIFHANIMCVPKTEDRFENLKSNPYLHMGITSLNGFFCFIILRGKLLLYHCLYHRRSYCSL